MSVTADKVEAYEQSVMDPAARRSDYERMVADYYGLVSDVCQSLWGTTHHFAVFSGAEDSHEAATNTERGLAERGGFREGMKVLDVGCGVGGPAFTIAAHSGAHVTGVDMVPARVEASRKGAIERGVADRTDFVVGDARSLDVVDGHFDGAYSVEALCHVPDKRQVHREIRRVLKPGAVWLGYDWIVREGLEPSLVERYAEPICRLHGLSHLSTLGELRGDLEAAGFEVEEITDASAHGDLEPNWTGLEQFIKAVPDERLSPRLRLVARGAESVAAGARAGVFTIGYWLARVPVS